VKTSEVIACLKRAIAALFLRRRMLEFPVTLTVLTMAPPGHGKHGLTLDEFAVRRAAPGVKRDV
jgi:hypothetical protein